MNSFKRSVEIDPDYENTESVVKKLRGKESNDKRIAIDKMRDLINKEFQRELVNRQNQLELIQQRLSIAQKSLHLLRYVLITSYYNSKELQTTATEEQFEKQEDGYLIDSQSRIHPALKKILGKTPSSYNLIFSKSPRKREKKTSLDNIVTQESGDQSMKPFNESTSCVVKIENGVHRQISMEKLNCDIDKSQPIRNRKKRKYRIVVGNISKWMPSDSDEDNSTHKWMVYVRGPKDQPQISHFVQKVLFYLHPSYKPNDVVELKEPPFHLSRRGWGEFPMRVQLFFNCYLNKPVDIIHNLKLDRTYTGRQTLGNETLIDLFLYDSKVSRQMESETMATVKSEVGAVDIKKESQENDHSKNDSNIKRMHFEHDYCYNKIKEEVETEEETFTENSSDVGIRFENLIHPILDHDYCLTYATSKSLTGSVDEEHDVNNSLIYGLTDMLAESQMCDIEEEITIDSELNFSILVTAPNSNKCSENFTNEQLQKIRTSDGRIIAINKHKRPQESLLKKIFKKKLKSDFPKVNLLFPQKEEIGRKTGELLHTEIIDYEKYKVDFPSHMFKNSAEALPFLLNRLPIICNKAEDINYKCTYPYVAQTLEEFSSWNIGKRLSCEWFRARTVKNIIQSAQLFGSKTLTTKCIIMFARSHGYTPLANYKIFNKKSSIQNWSDVESGLLPNFTSLQKKNIEPDILVNVVDCDQETEIISEDYLRMDDEILNVDCSYIKQSVLDFGLILKPEEIFPGVLFNGAERMILSAVMSLAENLIRKARVHLVHEGNFSEESSEIQMDHIVKALHDRPEWDFLLKSEKVIELKKC